jgi:hypothetical protein
MISSAIFVKDNGFRISCKCGKSVVIVEFDTELSRSSSWLS